MTEVRSINALRADREGDNTLLSPLELLEDAAEDIRSGVWTPDKIVVLMIDTRSDNYDMRMRCCNVRRSEVVAACEAAKIRALVQMGYTRPPEE